MAEEPNIPALLVCAQNLAARITNERIPDSELEAQVRDTLFGRKEAWACARKGIITRRETAHLILARLSTWIADRSGTREPNWIEGDPPDDETEKALFG